MAERDHEAVMEAAAALFARRQADAADAAEVDRWAAVDPARAAAYARIEAAWERADRLKALSGLEAEPRAWAPSRRWAAGLALALVGGGGGALAWMLAGRASERTALGERRVVSLEDGSRIELNTDSQVRIAYTPDQRRIVLTRGEALFEVAKDPARPFVVSVNGAQVRAVGTAFNIRLRDALVELTVTEGVVAVDERPAAAPRPARHVAQGQGAVIGTGAVAELPLEPEVLRRRLAWREGVIELEGETLEQAVEEFNRYNPRKLVVADREVAAIRVGGRFGVGEVDRFLAALQAGFPVRAVSGDGGEIYLVQDS